ncbi:hypothetical protein ONZ45_g16329 [Pleurotus djamor]|nr:hypothetical protein ONZ45_g16329 [Pleurotus djamor]
MSSTGNKLKVPTSGDGNVEHGLSSPTECVLPVATYSGGPYRVYKRRYAGLAGLFILNIVAAMGWTWFGPIAYQASEEFGISINQVNWLGNGCILVSLPVTMIIPMITQRIGIRRTCDIGAIALLLSGWIRYLGALKRFSPSSSYSLLLLGQFLGAIAPYQVLGPRYAETWFDLKNRTTATMLLAIARSVFLLAIIATAVTPSVFLIGLSPPTPPTYSGSRVDPPFSSCVRALSGKEVDPNLQMSKRERFDFVLLVVVFGVILAGTTSFALLTAQWFGPYGYSDLTSGLLGATLLLSGLVGALATAPLFDRVFTHHLALTNKVLMPIIGAGWLSLIWTVRPHNTAVLYGTMTVLGFTSVSLLPVGLELGCELTRNATGSSAILVAFGGLLGVVFTLAQSALRAGPNADPPFNMRHAIVFNGVALFAAAALSLFIKGDMRRKMLDEQKQEETKTCSEGVVDQSC